MASRQKHVRSLLKTASADSKTDCSGAVSRSKISKFSNAAPEGASSAGLDFRIFEWRTPTGVRVRIGDTLQIPFRIFRIWYRICFIFRKFRMGVPWVFFLPAGDAKLVSKPVRGWFPGVGNRSFDPLFPASVVVIFRSEAGAE